jgi:UDP-GlcNAc:undecaprenyl-phosphate GlcNAc-1-phosphate transferase
VTHWPDDLANAAVAAVVTYLAAWRYPGLTRPPVRANHRGVPLPLSLGGAVTLGLVALDVLSLPVVAVRVAVTGHGVPQKVWVLVAAIVVVFAAGAYDDRRPDRTHGVMAQLRPMISGRLTPGAVKLAALVVGAAAYAVIIQSPPVRIALGVPVVAGIGNLWNLLDVRPGRALKFALLAGVPMLAFRPTRIAARLVAVAAVAIPLDLRERAMLGDAGANAVGFVVGVAAFDRLSTAGLAGVLGLVVVLHALSETVTLSRLISAVPPLRWLDRLGRVRPVEAEGSTSG